MRQALIAVTSLATACAFSPAAFRLPKCEEPHLTSSRVVNYRTYSHHLGDVVLAAGVLAVHSDFAIATYGSDRIFPTEIAFVDASAEWLSEGEPVEVSGREIRFWPHNGQLSVYPGALSDGTSPPIKNYQVCDPSGTVVAARPQA